MKTLGFICKRKNSAGIYGVAHAEKELLNAIVKFSTWDRIVVWSEEELNLKNDKVIVRNIKSIIYDLASYSISCLHHVGVGASEFSELHAYFEGIIVTSVFPALSYHQQVSHHLFDLIGSSLNDVSIYPSHCSREVANKIVKKFSKRFKVETISKESVVIPIGVDTEVFFPATNNYKNSILDSENINSRGTICSVLTRFSPSDKADLLPLVRSIAYNKQTKDSGLTFLLLGGDNYYGAKQYIKVLQLEVERLGVTDFVKVLCVNDRERIVNLLRSSDIFLSPADSVQETYGITPIEAMACGVVPIVSDWNGYRETVVDKTVGFRAPTIFSDNTIIWKLLDFTSHYRDQHLLLGQSVFVDTEYMVDKCLTLYSDRETLAKMKHNALSCAIDKYTWKYIISKYEMVWARSSKCLGTEKCFEHRIDYWNTFSHYATKTSSDSDLYVISNYGQNVCSGKVVLQVFSSIQDVIPMDLIELILEQATKQPISVSIISSNFEFRISKIRFCVSFLHKQGLLSINRESYGAV